MSVTTSTSSFKPLGTCFVGDLNQRMTGVNHIIGVRFFCILQLFRCKSLNNLMLAIHFKQLSADAVE
jgi:hypothetical protein